MPVTIFPDTSVSSGYTGNFIKDPTLLPKVTQQNFSIISNITPSSSEPSMDLSMESSNGSTFWSYISANSKFETILTGNCLDSVLTTVLDTSDPGKFYGILTPSAGVSCSVNYVIIEVDGVSYTFNIPTTDYMRTAIGLNITNFIHLTASKAYYNMVGGSGNFYGGDNLFLEGQYIDPTAVDTSGTDYYKRVGNLMDFFKLFIISYWASYIFSCCSFSSTFILCNSFSWLSIVW